MKITLDAIDGQNFTLRLPRDEGGEQVIALHTTRRLRGTYAQDDQALRLNPVEADEVVGEVTWQLAKGSLRLAGPMRLGATSIDVDLARGDHKPAATGDARSASIAVPAFELTLPGTAVRGSIEVATFAARHDLATDTWTLTAASVDAHDLSLSLGSTTVSAASVTVTGLRLTRGAEAMTAAFDELVLTGAVVVAGPRTVRVGSARVLGLRYGAEGVVFDRVEGDELAVALEGLGARAADDEEEAPSERHDGPRRLGVDLPFLDGLHGRIEADTSVDVKLPVIHHRVATHRARLDVADGAIDFKVLEHGLSKLEDALLDFEVEGHALLLEVDALLAHKTLATWHLDADGAELARQDRVKLRTLIQPTLALPSGGDDEEEGDGEREKPVALQRVEVHGLLVEVGVAGASTLPVAGGTLRLGAEDASALGMLRLKGSLVHDTTQERGPTELHVELRGLDAGVDAMPAGGGTLDLARATLGHLTDGVVVMRGFTPASAHATLRELSLRGGRWRR